MLENGEDALFRGERVSILQKSDSNGIRYVIRLRGQPLAVRGVELSEAPKLKESERPETRSAPPVLSIPPAFVGLKKKIVDFKPTDFDRFSEILTMAMSLEVVDPNIMASEMSVSLSTLYNWARRSLKPPNRVMSEAVQYVNQHIAEAIAARMDSDRLRLQEQVNATGSAPAPGGEARSVATTEQAASVQVLEVQGQTYTIEVRQNGDLMEASCPDLPGLKAVADNPIDMIIDMKRLLIERPSVPDGEEYAGDRGLQEKPSAPEPASLDIVDGFPTAEEMVKQRKALEDRYPPKTPSSEAQVPEPAQKKESVSDAEDLEYFQSNLTKALDVPEEFVAETQETIDESPDQELEEKPVKSAPPDTSDSLDLLTKITQITGN